MTDPIAPRKDRRTLKNKVSTRASIITRRTYNRPIDAQGKTFESWSQTVDRVIKHQVWLWERAQNGKLSDKQSGELGTLRGLMYQREALTSGRSLWMAGTAVSRAIESTLFNCSFKRVVTVSDTVDEYWVLLGGCGAGFEPVVGTLSGFSYPVELTVIRSQKTEENDKGFEHNIETFGEPYGPHGQYCDWYIRVGDSAKAWAKLIGKILANKRRCRKLTLDFSEIRPAGVRLANYGWISSGDHEISKHFTAIVHIMNRKAMQLLNRIDIMDILNHLGATLSSRRAAEICLVPYGDPEWVDFARAKDKYWIDNPQRAQSNNSLMFYHKPSYRELTDIFDQMLATGGSEPGFINADAARRRAPWFKGVNPCSEILLGDGSFC